MHAPVGPWKVGQITQRLGLAQGEGIEQAHFDVGVAIERAQGLIEAGDAIVVQQQANANASFGGSEQRIEQQGAGNVVAPDVVLNIKTALGRFDQEHARGKGIAGSRQRKNAGQAGAGVAFAAQCLPQRGIGRFGLGEGLALGTAIQRWQGAADHKAA